MKVLYTQSVSDHTEQSWPNTGFLFASNFKTWTQTSILDLNCSILTK